MFVYIYYNYVVVVGAVVVAAVVVVAVVVVVAGAVVVENTIYLRINYSYTKWDISVVGNSGRMISYPDNTIYSDISGLYGYRYTRGNFVIHKYT